VAELISVIVSIYNREDALDVLPHSLAGQTTTPSRSRLPMPLGCGGKTLTINAI
jgi:hypothetical protein